MIVKITAVIPALNEAKHISKVVKLTKRYVGNVIVVDGGSTDNTDVLAKKAGAEILYSKRGYGRQVIGGLLYAKRTGADILVMLDSDGQHNPHNIPKLLAFLLTDNADIVMGCRVGDMPKYRRFGNRVLTYICNIGAKFKPYDALTGFWAIKADKLPMLTERFWGIALELFIKCRANGCRLTSVNVDSIYHSDYQDNSSTSPLKLGLNLLWYVLKWRVRCEVFK